MLGHGPRYRRRDVLKLAGSAVGVGGLAGTAGSASGASADHVRANVGYDSSVARTAALSAAERVIYDFAFDALTVKLPAAAFAGLDDTAGIRYVERDSEVRAFGETLPWGVDRVNADIAHANGEKGSGADVAIIDTGIDRTHPELGANLGEGTAFLSGVQHPDWQDDNGHGTHCVGIADALDDNTGVVGVSTEATLHAVKVLLAPGTGLSSDVAKGIEWTADQGYDVGNMSLGGSNSNLQKDAVQYATENGVLLVAAAGNSGPCEDCVSYPAAYEECIAVTATTKKNTLAEFSSTGPQVDLAAPGEEIYSTYLAGSYITLSGTSMAAPHVSGAAAQLMAGDYTNSEARRRLAGTAEDVGLSTNESGAGLLDVAAAVRLPSDADPRNDGGGGDGGSEDDGLLGLLGGL